MGNTLILQGFFVTLVSLAWLGPGGPAGARAAFFGGAVALANSLLLAWRSRPRQRHLHTDAQRHLRGFYGCALERLALTVALLAAGFGPLKLSPEPVLTGFIAGQLALLFAGLILRNTNKT